MENLKIIYIDDYPETSLSKYLDKYKNSSCNVESLDIKFNPDAGYESLINNPDVKSANIIFIDSKLFENRTAIAGKFTGERCFTCVLLGHTFDENKRKKCLVYCECQ